MPLSREQAGHAALSYLHAEGVHVTSISQVVTIDDATFLLGSIYCTRAIQDFGNSWIVFYRTEKLGTMLMSSNIVILDMDTGAVQYHGPANDEG